MGFDGNTFCELAAPVKQVQNAVINNIFDHMFFIVSPKRYNVFTEI